MLHSSCTNPAKMQSYLLTCRGKDFPSTINRVGTHHDPTQPGRALGNAAARLALQGAIAATPPPRCRETRDWQAPGLAATCAKLMAITRASDAIQRQRTTVASHERIGIFRIFGRDAGFTAIYTAYVAAIRCVIPEYKVDLDKLISLLMEDKRANPSNYALIVLSEGAAWDGYKVQEYGEADAYGHRKKASVAESLADEIKRRTRAETITSDLTYDLRSGDPDFLDKLVGVTFGNMAYAPCWRQDRP
jgi:6-phosphofructokinase 1